MRSLLLGGLLAGFAAVLTATTSAQDRSRQYSVPSLPPRAALDRMNLKQAWFAAVPMDGRRDGFVTIRPDGKQVIVQTRAGLVAALDAETGRLLWQTLPGRPYETGVPLTFNTFSVYLLNSTDLHSLDRRNGSPQWHWRLPAGISAAPVADDEQIYLCGSNARVYAMRVPKYDLTGRYVSAELEARLLGGAIGSAETRQFANQDATVNRDPNIPELYRSGEIRRGPRPILSWEMATYQLLEHRPLLSKEMIVVSGNNPATRAGRLMGFAKFPQNDVPSEIFRFPLDGFLISGPGQFENTAYVGGSDAIVYAVSMDSGRTEWRFVVGDPIVRAPVATAQDVYVTSTRNGMARLDRASGAPAWRIRAGREVLEFNSEVDHYLASNPKYVYAFDRAGRFLVVDRLQGKTLSRYDLLDYVYPVVNDVDDRIYLAANNGSIVCLHDKEYTQPLLHRKTTTEAEVIQNKLTKLITLPPVAKTPFRTFIREFEKAHELKITISDRAFREEDRQDSLTKEITLPAITNRPVMEVLQMALTQIDATSIVVRDTVLVAPKPRVKPMGGEPKP